MTPGIRVVTVVIVLAAWWAWGPVASAETAAGAGGSPPSADSPISLTLDGRGPVKVPGSVVSAPTTPVYALRTVPQPPVLVDGQADVGVPMRLVAPRLGPVYTAPLAVTPPTIDGRDGDAAWQAVPRTRPLAVDWAGRIAMPRQTAVRMVHDGQYLYLFADCVYAHADSEDWGRPTRDKVNRSGETVTFRLRTGDPPQETMVIFHVTGAFSDSVDQELGWDGDITAATSRDADGWHLEARVKLPDNHQDTLRADLWRNTSPKATGRWSWSQVNDWGLVILGKADLAVEDIRVGVFGPVPDKQDRLPVRWDLRNVSEHELTLTAECVATDATKAVLGRIHWQVTLKPGQVAPLAGMIEAPAASGLHLQVSSGPDKLFETDLPVQRGSFTGDVAALAGLAAVVRSEDFWLDEQPMPVYLLGQALQESPLDAKGELRLLAEQSSGPLWRAPVELRLTAQAGGAGKVDVPVAGLAAGRYVLEWTTGLDAQAPLRRTFDYVPTSHMQRLAQLGGAAALLESMHAPAPADQADLALLQYKLDVLADQLETKSNPSDGARLLYEAYTQATEIAKAIRDHGAWLGGRRGWIEAAFYSPVDGSAQPYALHIPAGYDPAGQRRYPMEVWLHGSGQMHYHGMSGDRKDWFVLQPLARGRPCGYSLVPGNDVRQLIATTKSRYRIDEDAVHIGGVSMGGFGSFTIASQQPDLFASCTPVCGGGMWCPLEQMRNVPTVIHHGLQDTLVYPYHSILSAMKLEHYGCPVQLQLHAGADHMNIQSWVRESDYREDLLRVRRDSQPAAITLSGDMLCFTRAYWAAIERFIDPQRPARVDATFVGTNRLVLSAHNTRWLSLKLPCKWVDPTRPLTIGRQDGLQWMQIAPGDAAAIYIRLDGEQIQATTDRPAELDDQTVYLGGAASMFSQGRPIRIAYGTGGDAQHAAAAKALAMSLRKSAFGGDDDYQVGGWPLLADNEVSDQVLATCDLILLGSPADNSLLARIADRLPVTLAGGTIGVQCDPPMQWAQDQVVFSLFWRNPLVPDRRIWWLGGFDQKPLVDQVVTPYGPDLVVARRSDGVRIASAQVRGDWELRRRAPLAPANQVWPTCADLCRDFAGELARAMPVDVVLSQVALVEASDFDYAEMTVGDAAELVRCEQMQVVELTGQELARWHARQQELPTQPATRHGRRRFAGCWAGTPADQLQPERTYRVLVCNEMIDSLSEAGLRGRIVEYVPSEQLDPIRQRLMGDHGVPAGP